MAKFQNVNGRRYYEEEEKEWLRDNYPKLGVKETTRQFNEKFNHNKNEVAIKKYCGHRLGLSVPKDVTISLKSVPVGYTFKNCRGEWKIKTQDGWKPLSHTVSGQKIQKGYVAFHLDGNLDNNSPDNIMVVKNGVQTALRNCNMISENADITRVAVTWLELYKILQNKIKSKEGDE